MDSFVLLAYTNLAASRTLLQRLLAPRFRRFILLMQTKKVISMNYGSSTSSWKPWRWVRFDLMILTIRYIYINSNLNSLKKFTSSSRSTEFKDISCNISQMITKTVPISTRIVISCAMKWGIVATSKFGLLTIRQHSATRKHPFLYPQGDRSGQKSQKG